MQAVGVGVVSIHAPWEGCDCALLFSISVQNCFNSRTLGRVRRGRPGGVLLAQKVSIHAPWEGCDTFFPVSSLMLCCFNSRTLGRVRLFHQRTPKTAALCFNSRTLGRVRPRRHHQDRRADHVSIHAPWEGCDFSVFAVHYSALSFQFTHPGKGATSDSLQRLDLDNGFNSRTLGRVRLGQIRVLISSMKFQFTHPGKGATRDEPREPTECDVSIHAPWEGCDLCRRAQRELRLCFNSRTLGRVRPGACLLHGLQQEFQFTHPGKGATTTPLLA